MIVECAELLLDETNRFFHRGFVRLAKAKLGANDTFEENAAQPAPSMDAEEVHPLVDLATVIMVVDRVQC